MVNVAIAGGTGGKAIPEDKDEAVNFGATILYVDYHDIQSLKATLEENQIHTVISTFAIQGDSLSTSQLNLIKAAALSSVTKRFAPSAFAIPYPRDSVNVLPPLQHYFESIDELKKTDLEWTVFLNGVFLDYFAMPHIKTYLKPNVLVVDIANRAAAIPGSGNELITFTYTFDLARFIIAALDLPRWTEESRIVGDQMTWNQFVEVAESTCGTPFTVQYDTIEKLKTFQITELPGHLGLYSQFPKERLQWFLAIFELWMAMGINDLSGGTTLNEIFPDVRCLTVKDMLEKYWKS